MAQQTVGRIGAGAVQVDLVAGQQRVAFALAHELSFVRGGYALGHVECRFAGRPVEQFFLRWRGHLDLHINAIEQRAGNARLVALHLIRRAAARAQRVAPIAARARVHRRDELEAGGEVRLMCGARDGDVASLQRFAQDFEYAAFELGELIEEQDPLVRERNLTRPRRVAAVSYNNCCDNSHVTMRLCGRFCINFCDALHINKCDGAQFESK